MVENNPIRVRLACPTQSICLYASHSLSKPSAKVEATSGGKLDRNVAGDDDNDGVVESTGAFQIRATGNAVELKLSQSASPLVVEISNLPPGKPLITLQGVLIDKYVWIADGRLLVEMPALTRSAEATVRVSP
jgi:hypothetical protein